MFGALTSKFQGLFQALSRQKAITEENISEAVREIRLALLEADVNYSVASSLVKKLKEKALGSEVLRSVSAGQQFTKIVYDELIALMGGEEAKLHLKGHPSVILLCGLQGSGKTTQCAKLALFLKKQNKKVLLAACDLQRPAAIEQLKKLSGQVETSFFSLEGEKDPRKVAKKALAKAQDENFDVLIIDTAGRLHVDEELMKELKDLKSLLSPQEILFVANATTGQDAVNTAAAFDKQVEITGSILTMLDSDTRGGAAISIREVTNKPLKFEGIGEKLTDLQLFHPQSMADRILGRGDVINLVKKAQEHIDEEESKKMEKKLLKASFTYDDYLKQMNMVRKMGSFGGLMKMIPGVSSLVGEGELPEKELKEMEAMIFSMTPKERNQQDDLSYQRRKRVAKGSGTTIEQVNRMVKNFKRMKQMMKQMTGMKGFFKGKLKEKGFGF